MLGYYTAEEIRVAEEATGELLTGGVLMARAASGVAQVALTELRRRTGGVYGRRVGMVIGAGNNGGDALYAGQILRRRGIAVSAVLLAPDSTHPGGLAAFTASGGRVVETLPADCDLVIDAVVGLGGRGPLRPAAAAAFAAVEGVPVLSVDLPSGIDPDTGVTHDPCVTAAVTVTFGAPRLAHALAAPHCGRVEVIDIGLQLPPSTVAVLTNDDVAALWPVPGPLDDKYSQGVVGIVAGSAAYPGAAVLCTGGSVAATSGMTRYAGTAAAQVVSHRPEVVATAEFDDAGTVQAWVVGPGLGTDARAELLVERVLATDVPVLVDADGLTVVARRPELLTGRTAPTLLTPHAGEFTRLARSLGSASRSASSSAGSLSPSARSLSSSARSLSSVEGSDDRLTAVRALAADLGVTVLLKGRITLVAAPDGQVLANDAQSSWAATAGAGDVLSGIAGALLAAGLPPREAGAAAARVHAIAAGLASRGAPIGASDLLAAVGDAIRLLRR